MIDPAITVNMFETSDIQLPSKISDVFQIKTKEYLARLEEFYLSRIESVLHDKFNLLLPNTPVAPKRPDEPKYEQRPDGSQYAEWNRRYAGGGLSRFSKKKKKTKKKRRPTKKRKEKTD